MCQHPEHAMTRRGNQAQRSWICVDCLNRWERLDFSEINQTGLEPSHTDLLSFGKYMGSTYQEVYLNDQEYCQWAMATVAVESSTSLPLRQFATYIHNQQIAQTYEADSYGYQVVEEQMEEDPEQL